MISFLLGLIIPELDQNPDDRLLADWKISQWWRFMLGFPIFLSLVQVALLLFVFPYDTPKMMK
jgi:hypothetical protein